MSDAVAADGSARRRVTLGLVAVIATLILGAANVDRRGESASWSLPRVKPSRVWAAGHLEKAAR